MVVSRKDFNRCNFCLNYMKTIDECLIGGNTLSGDCDLGSYRDYSKFVLEPNSVINKAKELEISVSDVLALIEACNQN